MGFVMTSEVFEKLVQHWDDLCISVSVLTFVGTDIGTSGGHRDNMSEKVVKTDREAESHADTSEEDVPVVATSTNDEATLFASPLPIVGTEKTTTRLELWVRGKCISSLTKTRNVL